MFDKISIFLLASDQIIIIFLMQKAFKKQKNTVFLHYNSIFLFSKRVTSSKFCYLICLLQYMRLFHFHAGLRRLASRKAPRHLGEPHS